MLRPERMSRVSVTGSKRVIDDVIETAYEHHSLHVSEYDGSFEGFDQGGSLEGAEEVNGKLVTVRSLESILDVDEADAGPRGVVDDAELDAKLAEYRERVNELDDRRNDLRGQIREIDDEIDRIEPFADLGIDLEYLSGYDTLEVVIGEADPDAVRETLADADGIEAFDVFAGGDTVGIFARPTPTAEPGVLQDALVGVDIAFLDVPDAAGSPEEYVAELESERATLETKLSTVRSQIEEVRTEAAGFLLRAEEQLTIEAQKKEAPLSFATTENAFVAEGWLPTETYGEFARTLRDSVGDHVEVEELERAEYTPDGDHHSESVHEDEAAAEHRSDPARESEAATDGGHEWGNGRPPVKQDNGDVAGPFELLVKGFGRPRYSEFDPTLLVFLTFPLMFGFMIGDIGYGILYAGIGYFLYANYEDAMREMGAVAIWAGLFTILFGIYYGIDVFGYHAYPHFGIESWAMSKGLSPGASEWALAWLVVSVLFGIFHLNVGYALSFVSNYKLHDLEHAMYESASWLLLLNGLWAWIFSQHVGGMKPDFLFDSIGVVTLGAVSFAGFPELVGIAGLVAAGLGAVLLAIGEPTELAEVLSPIVNVVSYARIMAVLLAKGGMALAANLLAFGAYIDQGGEGSFSFIFTPSNLARVQERAAAGEVELVFAGMTTSPDYTVIGIVGGLIVAVVGHIVVLLLGITAAGIQGIRLEYVEFFGKFYEGGGDPYTPFGYERTFTSEE